MLHKLCSFISLIFYCTQRGVLLTLKPLTKFFINLKPDKGGLLTLPQQMIKALDLFWSFVIRYRYPHSLPEDVAKDLGLNISNFMTFKEFMGHLTDPRLRPAKLAKFMPREQAEELFQTALRKEKFRQNSLFSYHFNGGWMEFMLQFDDQSRLRRIYIHHKDLKSKHELFIHHQT